MMRKSPQPTAHGPQGAGSRRSRREAGFTLIEVIVALAIVVLAVVPLIIENGKVMRDTAETRNKRVAWVLLAYKMAELEVDSVDVVDGGSDSGDFRDYDEEYAEFAWTWEAVLEEVPTNDPDIPDELPSEILRVTVVVAWESDKVALTGYFEVPEEEGP